MYNSIEEFNLNQYQNFQLIAIAFSFYDVFCEQYRLRSVPLYCVFIEVYFEK